MGDYAGMATEKMNQVAEQTGVVATRLTPYMTSMTAKFKGLGFQVDEATSLASEGLTIASDAAAFWDKSLEESMSHLNSFINGSYEGGEAIGLFANDTQMAAYALQEGIVSTTEAWSKLDEATKQSTRMRYAKEMMASSGATGQAAKEADEYANVLANMNEQFRQFQAVVGEPIMERIMLPAMRRINSLMPGITRRTGEFIDRFLGGMDRIGASIRSGWNPGAWAQGIGEAVTGAAQDMRGRLTALGQTISETWTGSVWPGMQAFFTELGGKLAGALGTGGEAVGIVFTGMKDFGQWCIDNRATIVEFFTALAGGAGNGMMAAGTLLELFADAAKGLAAIGMETVTGALQWTLEHGEAVSIALQAMAEGFAAAAMAAHPYAAAIVAAAAALGLMKEYGGEDRYDHFFDGYTDEDLAKLQGWVEAARALQEANAALSDALDAGADTQSEAAAVRAAREREDAAYAEANAVDGLIAAYNSWNTGQDGYKAGMYLDVPVRVEEGSEGAIQTELSGFNLQAIVQMIPDYSQIQTTYTAATGAAVDGSHASGLDFVPRDNYIARLHKGEAVLTSGQADAWRSGNAGGADMGRLEAAISSMTAMMQQLVNSSRGGTQIVLDSGVLVGQLAPAMDAQLGTISTRKGRRN